MNFPITKFSVHGLLGNKNYTLHIKDKATIIVGPNGSGKSNLLNIFYYFISKQWLKLYEFDFEKIEIEFNNESAILVKDEIASFLEYFPENSKIRDIYKFLEKTNNLSEFISSEKLNFDFRKYISEQVSCSTLLIENSHKKIKDLYFQDEKIVKITKILERKEIGQIIYMPTYRRIEKTIDLFQSYARRMSEKNQDNTNSADFIEVVNAGMDDVKNLINNEIQKVVIKKQQEYEKASQEYILDIINGKVKKYSTKKIKSLNIDEFKYFIKNIDSKIFNSRDISNLETKILTLMNRTGAGKPTLEEQYLSLYVEKLLNAQEKNKGYESALIKLTSLANKYIGANKNFDFLKSSNFRCINRDGAFKEVNLEGLSSGEKQLLSIFSYLLLSGKSNYILIIDEPELSLSVPWQKTLLPDIIATGNCAHTFAVTHSPFIFSNDLLGCVTDTQSMDFSE